MPVQISDLFSQGYARKGAALAYQKRYSEAETAYRQGLQHDPENNQLKDRLAEVEEKQSELPLPLHNDIIMHHSLISVHTVFETKWEDSIIHML